MATTHIIDPLDRAKALRERGLKFFDSRIFLMDGKVYESHMNEREDGTEYESASECSFEEIRYILKHGLWT